MIYIKAIRLSITLLLALSAVPGFTAGTSVSGTVIFEGKAPVPPILDTRGEAFCKEMHEKNPLRADGAEIGPKGEFAWIFVWIDNPPEGNYPAPTESAYLSQKNCRYEQPVLAFMTLQKLMIHNDDDTTHNVRGFPRNNKIFNFGQPPGLPPRNRTFKNAEMPLKIKCDVHSWMKSFAFVMDHPFFAVTDMAGAFKIDDLPLGTYTLKTWHEKLGELSREITVKDTALEEIAFTYRRPTKKK
ncbi:MAG: hypothetical protein VCB26_00470 [Candidatus Hydrogenedentota bacterium]